MCHHESLHRSTCMIVVLSPGCLTETCILLVGHPCMVYLSLCPSWCWKDAFNAFLPISACELQTWNCTYDMNCLKVASLGWPNSQICLDNLAACPPGLYALTFLNVVPCDQCWSSYSFADSEINVLQARSVDCGRAWYACCELCREGRWWYTPTHSTRPAEHNMFNKHNMWYGTIQCYSNWCHQDMTPTANICI